MVTRGERGVEVRKNESFSLASYLEEKRLIVESALDSSLVIGNPAKIYEAMRYSLLAGGKRLRPILCLATCELMGGSLEMALPTACALEMIHTMSLIHDDLPAMDNDDYRRGKLTNHKVFGEDIAILAGDGLLAYAFEYVATQTRNVPPLQILEVIARLGRTVGAAGLVGGQVLDLESAGKPDISVETLGFIHTQKTGSLLETSVVSGAVLAGAKAEDIAKLARYAQNIGLAFQIIDDVLDITATKEELGKTAGKDLQAQKATYPSLWGIEGSRQQAQQLIDSAIGELSGYDEAAEPLRAIAEYIVNRKN
ncbi:MULTISPECIES: geranylgeranyl diphosphate synthase CrtE [unclassified Microcystis]|uniref:geranylgeranyl diphosphate synthase CrtE n=1 Tax=unclassified Microcystis TaxID=2643300 RepID=UPI00258B9608|nr:MULTISPECIES: farnesyl diphosphate synthase [unclassified Microcystis]MCA2761941.1 polyprenyl synthetase family protein [Microcystis sp. M151S2]MCU7242660.1 polyprenyl synthetase family protein [Microcystis aeruginosa WS75]MCA2643956.1 polyprenyl synthetase family protein [Microcystis sp. M087S2]MCA2672046.1 polyprenyl synthetase family protein [Microcystis sp. M080S2]MCA2687886.1 polyprenyl synthetase family protein [Microcystis sp. M037S2]